MTARASRWAGTTLMNVLLAPHVTEKTSLALQERNQYAFRVRRDATRTDVRRAVELMFEVKVEGVQVVNEPGKSRRFGERSDARRTGRKPTCDSLRARASTTKPQGSARAKDIAMALIKLKPTSPGTRFSGARQHEHLHKGGPYEPLTVAQNKTGARNHFGRITTRHIGGGSRAEIPPDRFPSRQGRHRRRGRAHRVRPEPHRAHRAGALCRRRASLHPRAQGREGWR